jgi:hypothetical protein
VSDRQRRIIIKKTPKDGIQVEAHIGDDTPLDDVIQLLRELGYPQVPDENQGATLQELVEKIFQNYMAITRTSGDIIGSKLYKRWAQIGFDIIDLQTLLSDREAQQAASVVLEESELPPMEDTPVPPSEEIPEVGLYLPEPEPEFDLYPEDVLDPKPVVVSDEPDEELELVEYAIDEDPEPDEVPDEPAPDECNYCAKFRNVGTMVCPHCGKPLSWRS